ncbi:MAG: zinc-binding protein [Nitrospiraceae bacterium]|nr:zinc-binding protein [Nitrospiraceae bacterium]
MSEQPNCTCETIRYNLAFACSGAADVGAIADQAVRKLSREKAASMCCTAAIAAEIPDILEKATFAAKIVVLDGCDKACAKKIVDKGGFTNYAYIELGAMGMEKGKTPVNEESVAKTAAAASEALACQPAE